MRSEWRDVILGDIVEVKQGLAINAKSKHLLVDDGMPLLRITDLLNDNQVQFINAKEAPKQCLANADDLIYTRTGQVGHVFRGKVGVVHNNCFRVIPKTDSTTRGFLYWFLSQNKIRQYANDIASGSVQKDLNHSAFYSIPLSIPSKVTQLRIEKILNSIEDKIELNRKMNQTLEEMAQALFKSWFIDFDPVHAKAKCSNDKELETAAKELGISKEILELFPSEFEESELGMIPKGWEVKTIKDFGRVITGKTPPKKIEDAYSIKGKPFVTPTDIDDSLFVTNTVRYLSNSGQQAVKNSILSAGSICVTCIGSQMGKTTVAPTDSFTNQQINSIVLAKDNFRNYLLCNLRGRRREIFQLGSGGGSTMPLLNKTSFEKVKVLLPNINVVEAFDIIVKDNISLVLQNDIENNTLQKTRDTLLPKLLSGELDVSELEMDI